MSLMPHQPELSVPVETFEDLVTIRNAAGEAYGFEDPLTDELRGRTMHALGPRHDFNSFTIEGPKAEKIVKAVAEAALRGDELAVSAKDVIGRIEVPKRIKARLFMHALVAKAHRSDGAADFHQTIDLFDDTAPRREPIVWKSSADQSDKGKKFPHIPTRVD